MSYREYISCVLTDVIVSVQSHRRAILFGNLRVPHERIEQQSRVSNERNMSESRQDGTSKYAELYERKVCFFFPLQKEVERINLAL